MNSIQHIPKAEIHVHLEATISPDLCRKFAQRNKVELNEDIFGSKYAYAWEDFYDFIKKYDLVTSVIHTPEDYRELTYNYLKECAENNVIYVEAMVSSTHAKKKGMTYHSFLEGVSEGAKQAEKDFGIISKYIMNGIRHLGADSVYETAVEVLNNPHNDLVGFGLAGDELHFPPKLFIKTFDMLKEAKFPITVHAGEWDGPDNIRKAINFLHPTRLGHGVRSIEDPELIKELDKVSDKMESEAANISAFQERWVSVSGHAFNQEYLEDNRGTLSDWSNAWDDKLEDMFTEEDQSTAGLFKIKVPTTMKKYTPGASIRVANEVASNAYSLLSKAGGEMGWFRDDKETPYYKLFDDYQNAYHASNEDRMQSLKALSEYMTKSDGRGGYIPNITSKTISSYFDGDENHARLFLELLPAVRLLNNIDPALFKIR